eukprot:scaffold3031_cov116-Amphora_coffeaeformis.AAC.1
MGHLGYCSVAVPLIFTSILWMTGLRWPGSRPLKISIKREILIPIADAYKNWCLKKKSLEPIAGMSVLLCVGCFWTWLVVLFRLPQNENGGKDFKRGTDLQQALYISCMVGWPFFFCAGIGWLIMLDSMLLGAIRGTVDALHPTCHRFGLEIRFGTREKAPASGLADHLPYTGRAIIFTAKN